MGSVTEMNVDPQAWGWKILGSTGRKKKVGIEKVKHQGLENTCQSIATLHTDQQNKSRVQESTCLYTFN